MRHPRWITTDPIHWRIYVALGEEELMPWGCTSSVKYIMIRVVAVSFDINSLWSGDAIS